MDDDCIIKQSVKTELFAIDRETGLAQYEGDKNIYENILRNFSKNNKGMINKLKNAIDARDIKLAHRTAHSLRGAAGTIGATRLSAAAFAAENHLALMNRADSGFSKEEAYGEQLLLLEKEFEAVFDELEIYIEKETPEYHLRDMDREKTIALLDKLAPSLEIGDTRCLECLDEINEILRPVVERFELFITQMEQFDFEQAYDTMSSIRRFMTP